MTAPFAPALLYPLMRGSSDASAVELMFGHRAFSPGQDMDSYQIRRKQLAPTPGSYQYWDGDSWEAGAVWVDLAAEDGETVAIETGAWTSGATWEWSVRDRNAADEESPWAEASLLFTNTLPSLLVAIADPVVDSRPRFNWAFLGGPGRTQGSFQFAVFTEAEIARPGFTPGDTAFVALWRSDVSFSGITSSMRVEADLPSSGTYHLFGIVTDDTGLSSGWEDLAEFDTNFEPPTSPSILASFDPETCIATLTVQSQFNLLDVASSAFLDGVGSWEPVHNCGLSWEPSDTSMLMTFTGATYDELDAEFSDFDDEEDEIGTFDDSEDYRIVPNSVAHTADGTDGVAVLGDVVYSAVASVTPLDQEVVATIGFAWYTVSGTYISTTVGSDYICPNGLQTNIDVDSAESPTNARFVAIEITVKDPTNSLDDRIKIDNVAMAASADVEWSPGGLSVGIGFVAQRSTDGGDWEYVWGATHDSPAGAGGQGQDIAVIQDRAIPLGAVSVVYRVFAVSNSDSDPLYSLPTVTADLGPLKVLKWFFRSPPVPEFDFRCTVTAFGWSTDLHTDTIMPTGGDVPVVIPQSLPLDQVIRMNVMLLSRGDAIKFQGMLDTGQDIFLQQNSGEGFFFRPIGSVSFEQSRSSRGRDLPVDIYRLSFSAQVMA